MLSDMALWSRHHNGGNMKINSDEGSLNKIKENKNSLIKKAHELIANGINVIDPNRLDIRGKLACGKNVIIDINVIFEGDVFLGDGVNIGANCIIKDCQIEKNTLIKPFSFIDGAIIGESSSIGPYARIRPGSKIDNFVQIGNFVEIKNSQIAPECRINHHSFIGDAELSAKVTIGAGTITCNHNGYEVNKTKIGQSSYIGSNCSLVAPLLVNKNSTIGAGSTITEEVPEGMLTLSRARQVTIKRLRKTRE